MAHNTLRAARAGLNWTQERLAIEAGVHPKSVAYWERTAGQTIHPEGQVMPKVLDAFARHGVMIEGARITFTDPAARLPST